MARVRRVTVFRSASSPRRCPRRRRARVAGWRGCHAPNRSAAASAIRQPGDGTVTFVQDNDTLANSSVPFNDKEYIAAGPGPFTASTTDDPSKRIDAVCFAPITHTPGPVTLRLSASTASTSPGPAASIDPASTDLAGAGARVPRNAPELPHLGRPVELRLLVPCRHLRGRLQQRRRPRLQRPGPQRRR